MIWCALPTGSGGKSRLSSRWLLSPARSTSTATVRLIANMPPTPFSVNPKPIWMGVKPSTKTRPISEKPFCVLRTAMALTLKASATSSSSTPAYSWRRWSNDRKPPPVTAPASTARPMPLGGWNWKLSPGGGPASRIPRRPTRFTAASTGPRSRLATAAATSSSCPWSFARSANVTASRRSGPKLRWTPMVVSRPPEPLK